MQNIGIGLVWVVFIYVSFKIIQWAWPFITLLIDAGLALLGYGIAGILILAALFVFGGIMRKL